MADTPAEPSDGNRSPAERFRAVAREIASDATANAGQEATHVINQRIFETDFLLWCRHGADIPAGNHGHSGITH